MGLFEKSLILLLMFVMLFSGCVDNSQSVKNIITTSNIYVQNNKPLAGTTTLMEFNVVKKGHDTGDVIVDFFDTEGMIITDLTCQQPSVVQGASCVLKDVTSNDIRMITTKLQAPPRRLIMSETQYKVNYYIQHNYMSERIATFTVWDGVSAIKPEIAFTQGNPTDGPITLEFSQPGSGTGKGENIPYRKDTPFEMKITINNVGSGFITPQVVAPGALVINKENLHIAVVEGEILQCDFDETGGQLVSKKTTTLPATFTCYLTTTDSFNGYKTYTLSASFSYTYQYKYSETFTVLPTN